MWNRIIGIVGPSGSGKSFKAAEIMGQCERAAIYQIVRTDTNFLHCASDVFDGDIRGFCRALGEDQFRYVYRVATDAGVVEGNRIIFPDFEWFIASCFERRDMMMIIDEAHFLCDPRYIPPRFRKAIITGRHEYIDICYITQRFAMVHHDLTANTHEFYFYRISEPSDLESIEKRCGREVRERVSALRGSDDQRRNGGIFVPGEMFYWNKSGTKIPTGENVNGARDNATDGAVRDLQGKSNDAELPDTRGGETYGESNPDNNA